jgi:putative ABC transport system substrate-binding protein
MVHKVRSVRRRDFITIAGGASFAWPLIACAQRPDAIRRVGLLIAGSPPDPVSGQLRRYLRDLGYSEGQNVAFEVRYAMNRSDRAAELARELVTLNVDIIVAHFTPAAIAAKEATRTIPIVMSSVGAPVENGLVESLARPGRNITGISSLGVENAGKRLELLRQLIPNLSRVAVLASNSTTNPFVPIFLRETTAAAGNMGIRLEPVLISGPTDLERAFAMMAKDQMQAVMVQLLFEPHRAIIIELAERHRLATIVGYRESAVAGGLISYAANQPELIERVAVLVDKILKGAKPAELPVEQPTTFELVINLKAAKALGIEVPPSIFALADEVIESSLPVRLTPPESGTAGTLSLSNAVQCEKHVRQRGSSGPSSPIHLMLF